MKTEKAANRGNTMGIRLSTSEVKYMIRMYHNQLMPMRNDGGFTVLK
jgi:hypothetical protein